MEENNEIRVTREEVESWECSAPITTTSDNMDMTIKYGGYKGFKAKLDFMVKKTANDIVGIGEMLKEARDTDILNGSGYSGMGEFAEKEYGFHPSQTSRFIAIADKYGDGKGGLRPEFQEYGQTKLSEMLTLPDNVAKAIPPEMTRDDIRVIKGEVKAEEAVTPLEVMAEAQQETDQLTAMLQTYFQARPEDAKRAKRVIEEAKPEEKPIEIVLDALAPSGIGVLESRPAGMGRIMLSFNGRDNTPKMTVIREDKAEDCTWATIRDTIEIILEDMDIPEDVKEAVDDEKLRIAPAQAEERENVEAEKAEEAAGNSDLDGSGREDAEADSKENRAHTEGTESQRAVVKKPLSEPQNTLEPMNRPEEDPYKVLRGSEEGRNCTVAIKTKAHNLETICRDAARMKADEERYMVQDLTEKFELEAQDMQKALEEFLAVRLKEEADEA